MCLAGVKMTWHHHVHFELHGVCSALQGRGDFAIQEVRIATNQDVRVIVVSCCIVLCCVR